MSSITPFREGYQGPKEIPSVNPGMDTSEINQFRDGIYITLDKYWFLKISPKLSIDGAISQVSYGASYGYDKEVESTRFEDSLGYDPIDLLAPANQNKIENFKLKQNAEARDGIVQVQTRFDEIVLNHQYKPYKQPRGEIDQGNENYLGNREQIFQKDLVPRPNLGEPFHDNIDQQVSGRYEYPELCKINPVDTRNFFERFRDQKIKDIMDGEYDVSYTIINGVATKTENYIAPATPASELLPSGTEKVETSSYYLNKIPVNYYTHGNSIVSVDLNINSGGIYEDLGILDMPEISSQVTDPSNLFQNLVYYPLPFTFNFKNHSYTYISTIPAFGICVLFEGNFQNIPQIESILVIVPNNLRMSRKISVTDPNTGITTYETVVGLEQVNYSSSPRPGTLAPPGPFGVPQPTNPPVDFFDKNYARFYFNEPNQAFIVELDTVHYLSDPVVGTQPLHNFYQTQIQMLSQMIFFKSGKIELRYGNLQCADMDANPAYNPLTPWDLNPITLRSIWENKIFPNPVPAKYEKYYTYTACETFLTVYETPNGINDIIPLINDFLVFDDTAGLGFIPAPDDSYVTQAEYLAPLRKRYGHITYLQKPDWYLAQYQMYDDTLASLSSWPIDPETAILPGHFSPSDPSFYYIPGYFNTYYMEIYAPSTTTGLDANQVVIRPTGDMPYIADNKIGYVAPNEQTFGTGLSYYNNPPGTDSVAFGGWLKKHRIA